MSISLYDAVAPGYLQILGGVAGFMDKAAHHASASGIDLEEIVETSLFPDMLPFKWQIQFTTAHSVGAIEGVKAGVYHPPRETLPPDDFAGLQKLVADTRATLSAYTRDEIEGLTGKDVFFALGQNKLPFAAEGFLFSFAIPNFHFHATTAYDILRSKGVPLGKRDYLGHLQLKAA